jgi:hypothetical protein
MNVPGIEVRARLLEEEAERWDAVARLHGDTPHGRELQRHAAFVRANAADLRELSRLGEGRLL